MSSVFCARFRKILPQNFKLELCAIFRLAWPLMIFNLAEFMIPLVTLQFIGQYGETSLAAVGLGLTFCNIFGFSIVVGLDTATATLCAQSYGAKNYRRFGILIQRALIIQFFVAMCMLAVWINSGKILLLLHQDKDASRIADLFIIWRAPSFILQGVCKTLRSYLTCQHIVIPLVVVAFITIGLCVVFNVILVNVLQLGVIGSSLAINLSYVVLCVMILAYIKIKKVYKMWPGWSWECLLQWRQFASLALPGSLMVIFDWTTAEVGVFLLGLVGKVELGAQSVLFNIIAVLFTIPASIAIAAAINVGKYLGSGEPRRAVNSAKSAVILAWMIAFCVAGLITGIKDYIGYAFTNSKNVIKIIKDVVPIMAGVQILDGTQGLCCGILRGLGLQKYGATINFIGYDIIGLPLGTVFALVFHWNVMGFWAGLSIGQFCQAATLMILLAFISWEKQSKKARSRAGIEENLQSEDNGLKQTALTEVEVEHRECNEIALVTTTEVDAKNDYPVGSETTKTEIVNDKERKKLLHLQQTLNNQQTISKLRKLTHIMIIICIPSILLVVSVNVRLFL